MLSEQVKFTVEFGSDTYSMRRLNRLDKEIKIGEMKKKIIEDWLTYHTKHAIENGARSKKPLC